MKIIINFHEYGTTFIVAFNSNSGYKSGCQIVNANEKATELELPPNCFEGFELEGWYTNDYTFNNRWNFDKSIVTDDTILYAKWKSMCK